MPARIKGVSSRLIEAAREEFLEKGFDAASIRNIAAKAETSPRAVYTRFENKEELFAAVVEPVAAEFRKQFRYDKEIDYWDAESAAKRAPEDYYIRYLEFAYSHKTEFTLILKCSANTRYENFIAELADADVESVVSHLDMLHEPVSEFQNDKPAELFVRNITYSFYRDLFKPFCDGYDLEISKSYAVTLTNFYNMGLSGIMQNDYVNT